MLRVEASCCIVADMDAGSEMYDTKKLAKALGVTQSAIRSMKSRGKLPQPDMVLNGGCVWSKETLKGILEPLDTKKNVLHNTIDKRLPPIIDLFSGCGGMSLGFSKAHYNVVAAFDNWPAAVETYNFNFNHRAQMCDLSNLSHATALLTEIIEKQRSTPAIIGGPPCQDFSSAGKRQEGSRANLTQIFASLVTEFNPPFFVMENVARSKSSKAYAEAKKIFRDSGYIVESIVLDASRCGVPQTRKRLITFGSKDASITNEVMQALAENQSSHHLTVREWFKGNIDTEVYYRHPRSYARRAIFSIDEPSPTIRGVNRPIPVGYPGHPGDSGSVEDARPLTTRERASIQTFPEDFMFLSSKTNNEQLIGNAVPVELAYYVANQIKATYLRQASAE